MLNGIIKGFATQVLQHLLAQNSWADAMLQPFAGKSVQFKIAMVETSVVILENGSLAIVGDTQLPDATVTGFVGLGCCWHIGYFLGEKPGHFYNFFFQVQYWQLRSK